MKHKIGDMVKLKPLNRCKSTETCEITSHMKKHFGEEIIIEDISVFGNYRYEKWFYHPDWIQNKEVVNR